MYEERTFVRRKTKAELEAPSQEFMNFDGTFRVNPVVEVGAAIADYAQKDEEVKSLWFKPTGLNSCIAVIEYSGDGPRIARNMHALTANMYPGVRLTCLSTNSERGKEMSKSARLLYKEVKRKHRRKFSLPEMEEEMERTFED